MINQGGYHNRVMMIIRPLKFILLIASLFYSQAGFTALKQLYLEDLGGTPFMTRAQPTAPDSIDLTAGSSVTVDQTIAFQAPFTINATNITVTLSLQKIGGGASRTAEVEVFINGILGTSLGTDQFTWSGGGPTPHNFTITNAVAQNLLVGDYLTVVVRNNTATDTFRVRQAAGGTSYLEVDTNTVITIDNVGIHSNPYSNPEEFSSYTASTTVYLRATVSDPFGFADISSVDFVVNDPNSPPSVFTANIITPEAGSTVGATAVFETPYTLPAIPAPDGVWSVDFTANEGSEGAVTAVANKSFGVGSPMLNVLKTSMPDYDPVNMSSFPKAIPNSHIEYTVEVTNSGFGSADNNSILITDPIPAAQTTFYFGNPIDPVRFVDGAVTSGLSLTFLGLADPTDDIDFYSDVGCTTIIATPVADASGYDISSPKVRCIGINPKGDFNGAADLINFPSFSVNFTVRLD
jgi:uncharacterized repeat protein (TIGR01451 family)